MSTILLVRHAPYPGLGERLVGRSAGFRLDEGGRAEAARLAQRLARSRIDVLLSSPRERCLETAAAIASRTPVSIEGCDELDEVDFGAWTGRDFESLAGEPAWRLWNEQRSLAKAPGGESMLDVQRRVMSGIARAASLFPQGVAVLVSHAEPIRAAIAHILGFSLDAWSRLDIAPASVSRIILNERGAQVFSVNETFA